MTTPPRGKLLDRARQALHATFGYTTFRPLQEEIVTTILAGRDAFVLMPTGGGKSLCYQLPALLGDRPTIVISPLIALMKDQVDALQAAGVSATFINSSLDPAEAARRQAEAARGAYRLIYAAPERLMTDGFLRLLQSVQPACFAIDEAHCISEWGHDFRPEYRELRRLRPLFPSAAFAAFTATATARVQTDIKKQLGLERAASFQGSFNRANLYYDVRPKRDSFQQLVRFLRGRKSESGIIYCQSRQSTETLAARLQSSGFSAAAYHAGLEADDRRRRQEAFVRDDVRIIVATVAFGMGIDKPDVRFVVHYDLPKNLEGYYQESGRAGRDGEPADCLLFYSYADVIKYQRFIDEKQTEAERRLAQEQLRLMANWAANQSCRRRALLSYFDERWAGEQERCCDVCSGPREPVRQVDYTEAARLYLSCVRRTGERFGATYIVDVLRAAADERIVRYGHDRLKVYGRGADRPAEEWRHIGIELLRLGYVRRVEEEYNALKLTESGLAALTEGTPVLLEALPAPVKRVRRDRAPEAPAERGGLFEALRALRKRLADERKVPPYVIFPDAVLSRITEDRPRTRAQLLRIPGVGERKAADFGDAFLAIVATEATAADNAGAASSSPSFSAGSVDMAATVRHVAGARSRVQAGAGSSSDPAESEPAPKRGATPTYLESLLHFEQGRTVEQVAEQRGLAVSTVMSHLAQAIGNGAEVELDRLITPERRRAIASVMAELGSSYLKPVRERLGDGYSYGELLVVQAAVLRTGGVE